MFLQESIVEALQQRLAVLEEARTYRAERLPSAEEDLSEIQEGPLEP